MQHVQNLTDPVPPSALPSLTTVTTPPPVMPAAFTATVILHPFSPPLSTDPRPLNPFFQLCTATIKYVRGVYFSAQIVGTQYGSWWYFINDQGTQVSIDGGITWAFDNLGWTLPENWYGAQASAATCAGSSPLNWMNTEPVEWWKLPVPIPNSPAAATWLWFQSDSVTPVRLMFGQGPQAGPTMGDPTQLAFFQMWSFTYFASFQVTVQQLEKPAGFSPVPIPGFQAGNPDDYSNFVWNGNFGMTAFMTPVNELFNPLPTRVLYVWKPDNQYQVYSDRAQSTLMQYIYNSTATTMTSQVALLTGPAPTGTTPPAFSDEGFLISYYKSTGPNCIGGSSFPFPQEAPDWISMPGVNGHIQATISNNPVLAPNTTVTIFSVLFPPSPPNYPEATYLWTWYAPLNQTGTQSRPITFMQSQSGVGVGTSLALADYFYYNEFSSPIDPSNFTIPSACRLQTRKNGLRRQLF